MRGLRDAGRQRQRQPLQRDRCRAIYPTRRRDGRVLETRIGRYYRFKREGDRVVVIGKHRLLLESEPSREIFSPVPSTWRSSHGKIAGLPPRPTLSKEGWRSSERAGQSGLVEQRMTLGWGEAV